MSGSGIHPIIRKGIASVVRLGGPSLLNFIARMEIDVCFITVKSQN